MTEAVWQDGPYRVDREHGRRLQLIDFENVDTPIDGGPLPDRYIAWGPMPYGPACRGHFDSLEEALATLAENRAKGFW